jgi:hypothetical protein
VQYFNALALLRRSVELSGMALHFRYETHFTFLTADGHALKDQVSALGLDINELPQVRRRSRQSCKATSPSKRSCWMFFLGEWKLRRKKTR